MIGSPGINKVIRRIISPVLRENGFSKVNTRNNWGWHDHCIWVLDIRAVGKYFSDVSGWPPMSISIHLGIYYDFIPEVFSEQITIKQDDKGGLIPKEYECHSRATLLCTLNQSHYTKVLGNPADRKREDIWWVEPDGSNIEEVVNNIKDSFLSGKVKWFEPYIEDASLSGIEWFNRLSDVDYVLRIIEPQRDCYAKFYNATFFAKHLGYKDKFEEYKGELTEEAKRIGNDSHLKSIQKEMGWGETIGKE